MKITSVKPERHVKLVKTKQAGMHTLYDIIPAPLGEIQYKGVCQWVTEDGMEFRDQRSAEKYMVQRHKALPRTIEPGEYTLEVKSQTQQAGRLVFKTRQGDEIIINLR